MKLERLNIIYITIYHFLIIKDRLLILLIKNYLRIIRDLFIILLD